MIVVYCDAEACLIIRDNTFARVAVIKARVDMAEL
jgi:hypothetical protein